MADEYPLSFFLEWYDPQAEQLKPYVLHYHTDDTLELVGDVAFSNLSNFVPTFHGGLFRSSG